VSLHIDLFPRCSPPPQAGYRNDLDLYWWEVLVVPVVVVDEKEEKEAATIVEAGGPSKDALYRSEGTYYCWQYCVVAILVPWYVLGTHYRIQNMTSRIQHRLQRYVGAPTLLFQGSTPFPVVIWVVSVIVVLNMAR
jgi:hypothetical protein